MLSVLTFNIAIIYFVRWNGEIKESAGKKWPDAYLLFCEDSQDTYELAGSLFLIEMFRSARQ